MMSTSGKKSPKMTRGANDVVHLLSNLPPATSTDVCKLCAADIDSDEETEDQESHRNKSSDTASNSARSGSDSAAATDSAAASRKSSEKSNQQQQQQNQEAQKGNEIPQSDTQAVLSKIDITKLQNLAQFNVTFYPHATRHSVLNRPIKFNFRIPMAYPSTPPVIRCTSRWFLDSYSSYFQINPDDGRIKLAILQGNTSNGNYFGSRSSKGEEEIDAIGWLRTYNLASVAYALHQQLADPLKISTRLVTIGKNCVAHQPLTSGNQDTPKERNAEVRKEPFLSWGQSEAKGRRPQMEDAMNAGVEVNVSNLMELLRVGNSNITAQRETIIKDSNETVERSAHLFGVYDGHGGSRVSEFIAEQMQKVLEESLSNISQKECIQQHILSNNSTMWGDPLAKKETPLSPDLRLASAILHGLRRTFSSLDAEYTKSLIEHAEKFASKMGTSATEAFGLGQMESDAPEANSDSILSSWPCPLPSVQDCKTASMLDGSGSTVCACVIVRPKGSTAGETGPGSDSEDSQSQALSKKGIIQRNINRLIYREPLTVGATDFSLPLGPKMTQYNFGNSEVDAAALSSASKAFEDNDTSGFAVLAHAGDSRAVMAVKVADHYDGTSLRSKMIALELTHDHKADPGARPDETARIAAAGGAVMAGRVSGRLAVARAVGDPSLKWGVNTKVELKEGDSKRKPASLAEKIDTNYPPLLVTSDPELCLLPLDSTCCFLILACDGLWDVVTSQDAVNEVTAVIRDHENRGGDSADIHAPAAAASQKLVHLALEKGSMDNVSVSVVLLREPQEIVTDSKEIPVSTAAVNIWTHYDAEEDIENPSATLLNNALQGNSKPPEKNAGSSTSSNKPRRTSSTSSEENTSGSHEPRSAHQPVGAPRNPANPFAGRRNKGSARSRDTSSTIAASKSNSADTGDKSKDKDVTAQVSSTPRNSQSESSTASKDSMSKTAPTPSHRQGDTFRKSASRGLLGSNSDSTSEAPKKHDSLSALTLESIPTKHSKKRTEPQSARSLLKREHFIGEEDTLDNLMAEARQTSQGPSSEHRPGPRGTDSSTRRRSTPQLSAAMAVSPTHPVSQQSSHSRKAGRQNSQRNELARFM
eukprot:gb/GECG01008979.1/.p1 GENE.gb/GECG01008979.1/~~gb/GECG01008979.1/.p1  ORF type:complete len:1100 (+),score=150.99 gb/GECG01008979.1/:1-3300(+)